MTRLVGHAPRIRVIAVLLALLLPAALLAQGKKKPPAPGDSVTVTPQSIPTCYNNGGCYNSPPSVTINVGYYPVSAGARGVSIRYCDDWNLGNPSTTLNGSPVSLSTTSVSGCTATLQASGTIYLTFGMNTLTSSICDVRQFYLTPTGPLCTTRSATLEYRTVDVAPIASTVRIAPTSAGQRVTFRVRNLEGYQRSYAMSCSGSGAAIASACSTSVGTIALNANDSVMVDAVFTTGASGTTGSVSLRATDVSAGANTHAASVAVNAAWPPGSASPIIAYQTPTNNDRFAPGMCVLECLDLTASHATPAYVSLGMERSALLTYRGQRARPAVRVALDIVDSSWANPATTIAVRMIDPNGAVAQLANGTSQVVYSKAYPIRVYGLDTAQRATGVYTYRVELFSTWNTGVTRYDTVSVRVLVNNGRTSPYGAGWDVAGVERVYASGWSTALLVDGAGGYGYYANAACTGPGACTFTSPPSDFSTLQRNADGTYTRSYRDGTVVSYDAAGLMTQLRDRIGNTSQVDYVADGSGRIRQIVDPMGKALVFSYADSAGGADKSLRGITDPMGRRTSYVVDGANDLVQIVDPDNVVAFQGTYAGHQLLTATDRRGGVWTYTLASDRTLRSVAAPTVTVNGVSKNPTVRFTSPTAAIFDSVAAGGATAARPFPGFIWDSAFGSTTTPSGMVTRYVLNRFGQAVLIRGPKGETSTASYDTDGLATAVYTPKGSTSTQYGAGGLPSVVTAGGVATTYSYGSYDLVTATTSEGLTTTYWYNAAGSCIDSVRVGATSAKKTRYTCDSRGRVLTQTDPEGHRSWTTYDPVTGNIAKFEAQSDTTTRAYRTTSYYYDAYGRDTLVIDPSGAPAKHFADRINRDTLVIAPKGLRVATHYDNLFVREVIVAGTQRYAYTMNALGWVESVRDTTGTRTFSYDSTGAVNGIRNKRGQLTQYGYDLYGRLLSRTLADGRVTKFAYDSLGRWVSDSSAEGVDTIRTNARGAMISTRSWRGGHRYEILHRYDSDSLPAWIEFNRDSVAFPVSGRSYYYYDSAGVKQYTGLLYGLGQQSAASRTTIWHNADGLARQRTYPTGVGSMVNTFGSNDRVIEAYFNSPASSVLGRNYAWDILARITSVANADGSVARTFAYDSLGQLVKTQDVTYTAGYCHPVVNVGMVCDPGTSTITATSLLSYDVVGNRTDGGAVLDPGNRMRAFSGLTMDYDADGNVVRRATAARSDALFWSSDNQLDSVQTPGGTVSFGYDGFGHRVRKTFAGVTTRYFYDGDNLYAQTDGAGNIARIYHYYPGTDTPAQLALADGSLYHYVQDESGNVIAVLNGSGQAVAQYKYSPFGTLESGSTDAVPGGGNPLRFKARVWDAETDLYENRARYYDATLGRFISEDPIGISGGINLYAYVGNDPINRTDPSGLKCESFVGSQHYAWYEDGVSHYFQDEGYLTCCGSSWEAGMRCEDRGGPSSPGGAGRQPSGGGGGAASPKPKRACNAVAEFSAGVNVMVGGPVLAFISGFGQLQANVGVNSGGQLFVQFSASATAGIGVFAGVGYGAGGGVHRTAYKTGWSGGISNEFNANAALGLAGVGGTLTADRSGGTVARGHGGLGIGVQVSGGKAASGTLASPVIIPGTCRAQ